MKCCSRSTLGVVIGSLNLILYAIAIIASIVILVGVHNLKDTDQHNKELLDRYNIIFPILIVLCLIMSVISALLITGIVKRRHNLMLPWIILTAIGFVVNCLRTAYTFIILIVAGVDIVTILVFLFVSLLGITISGLILWAIYNLYKDIREDNVHKPGRVMYPTQVDYSCQKP